MSTSKMNLPTDAKQAMAEIGYRERTGTQKPSESLSVPEEYRTKFAQVWLALKSYGLVYGEVGKHEYRFWEAALVGNRISIPELEVGRKKAELYQSDSKFKVGKFIDFCKSDRKTKTQIPVYEGKTLSKTDNISKLKALREATGF